MIVLVLSGCGGKKNAEVKDVLKSAFEAQFSYSYGGQEFSGSFKRGIDGDFSITLLSPKSLENVIFYYKDGKTEVSFDGFMKYEVTADLPENSVVGLICKTLENAISNNTYEGKIGSTGYSLSVKDGALTEIKFGEVVIKITDFVKI